MYAGTFEYGDAIISKRFGDYPLLCVVTLSNPRIYRTLPLNRHFSMFKTRKDCETNVKFWRLCVTPVIYRDPLNFGKIRIWRFKRYEELKNG